jgi:tetratricopeptide (TPR) repeat protein
MGLLRGIAKARSSDREKGDAARDSRDWAAAAQHYAAYLAAAPDDAAIWVQLGHARKEAGDLGEAGRAYLRALSLDPDSADTCVQLGHVEKLKGRAEGAFAWYRRALDIAPDHEPALTEFENAPEFAAPAQPAGAKAAETLGPMSDDVVRRIEAVESRLDDMRDLGAATRGAAEGAAQGGRARRRGEAAVG